MNDLGLVTCRVCGASFDRDHGKCWKCGTRDGTLGKPIKSPFGDLKDKEDSTTSGVLGLAVFFVLLGACTVAPGLSMFVIIGYIVYYAGRRERKKGGGETRAGAKSFGFDSVWDFLFRFFATLFLLPVCISIGLFIICGGFFTVASFGQVGDAMVGSFLAVMIPAIIVAALLFWFLSKALLRILNN